MNKYYNFYPNNFGNEYDTIYVENPEQEKRLRTWYCDNYRGNGSLERVTVKELRELASLERWRRKHDQSLAYFCSPWDPLSVDEFLNLEY